MDFSETQELIRIADKRTVRRSYLTELTVISRNTKLLSNSLVDKTNLSFPIKKPIRPPSLAKPPTRTNPKTSQHQKEKRGFYFLETPESGFTIKTTQSAKAANKSSLSVLNLQHLPSLSFGFLLSWDDIQ